MNNIINYLKVFILTLIVAFVITIGFVLICNHDIKKGLPALVDLESGEIIRLPEFNMNNEQIPESVCLRNSNGAIVFWGEFDYSTSTLCGNLFTDSNKSGHSQTRQCFIGILNPSSDKIHYLDTNPTYMQVGEYYITYNCNTVITDDIEDTRYNLTIHYCHNH